MAIALAKKKNGGFPPPFSIVRSISQKFMFLEYIVEDIGAKGENVVCCQCFADGNGKTLAMYFATDFVPEEILYNHFAKWDSG